MNEMFINKLIELNQKALKNNDVPVSCLISKNNKIISYAYNKKIKNKDPFAHAEILAIRKAAKKLKTYNLSDCEIYVTLFPCKMCQEVINEARIKKVHYILNKNKDIVNTTKYIKIKTEQEIKFSKELSEFFYDKR